LFIVIPVKARIATLAVRWQRDGTVELTDRGEFFCLHCETARGFELRTWRQTYRFVYVEFFRRSGEFVRCDACGSAFRLERLDESSTASLETLREFPPPFARSDGSPPRPAPVPLSLAEYLDG
jgi:hypothetical protein